MLTNSINYEAFQAIGVWHRNMFSHIHLSAGITYSFILHSSLFTKYLLHQILTHKDTHAHSKILGTLHDTELQHH